jgi:phenylacetate-CoA ligase
MSIYDRRYETMPGPELEQVRLERLQALVARLRRNVRRYREKLADIRVESLADLERLPLTTPEDLLDGFPYGMFAFPLREIIRLHSTLGPEGKPLVVGHTRNDLAQWARLVARQLAAAGVTPNDVIQVSTARSIDAAASGFVLGAELLEASVIAEDPLHIDHQFEILRNYRPTFLITTPGTALELMRTMEKRRMDPQSLQLRALLLSRPVSPELREQLSAGLFTTVRRNFGVDEVLNPGLCLECEAGRLHVHEDHFLVEICEGELVVTTLTREALPLLRYRTRHAATLRREKCPCGRTSLTLEPGARLDQRHRVLETEFYERQVAEVLEQTRAAGHGFRLDISDRRLVIVIEMSERLFANTISTPGEPPRDIESEVLSRLGIEAEVQFVQPAPK